MMNKIFDAESLSASINIEAYSKPEIGKPFFIKGRFNILYDNNGITVRGSKVLKHIVLVVTRGGNHSADGPFQDIVVFDDDVTETKSGCSGAFHFNLFDKIGFDGSGDYYILCSLGTVTSNIIYARFDEK